MKEKKSYLIFIFIGAILILIRLIDYNKEWSFIDWIKIVLGVFFIFYGIHRSRFKS
jgi:hypothetical protein